MYFFSTYYISQKKNQLEIVDKQLLLQLLWTGSIEYLFCLIQHNQCYCFISVVESLFWSSPIQTCVFQNLIGKDVDHNCIRDMLSGANQYNYQDVEFFWLVIT